MHEFHSQYDRKFPTIDLIVLGPTLAKAKFYIGLNLILSLAKKNHIKYIELQ